MRTTISTRPATRHLSYIPPYDWETVLSALQAHQLPYVESVNDAGYERVIRTKSGMGWFRVVHDEKLYRLRLTIWNGDIAGNKLVASAVRRMFDLDADPSVIGKAMQSDPYLSAIWLQHPGLRVFRVWNGFESMLTTTLGQLVSVSFGRTLTKELMETAGEPVQHPKTGALIHLFPTAKRLLQADLSSVRTSKARRAAIHSLATLVAEGTLKWDHPIAPKELRKILLSVDGIGAWTSEYIAMRGFNDHNAFPATDYGLKQELKRHPQMDVNRVRPWRAYAAAALWKSFTKTKGAPYESVV